MGIYIAYEDATIKYKDRDVRVTIDKSDDMKIISIDRYSNNEFVLYDSLNQLYEERNAEDGKYSIHELYEFH